jgi:hypothetical protein
MFAGFTSRSPAGSDVAFMLRPVGVPAAAPQRAPRHAEWHRLTLADGERTTLHVAAYDLARFKVRAVRLRRPLPLPAWCAREGVEEALVGGFFIRGGRHDGRPLGELRTPRLRPSPRPLRRALARAPGRGRIDGRRGADRPPHRAARVPSR